MADEAIVDILITQDWFECSGEFKPESSGTSLEVLPGRPGATAVIDEITLVGMDPPGAPLGNPAVVGIASTDPAVGPDPSDTLFLMALTYADFQINNVFSEILTDERLGAPPYARTSAPSEVMSARLGIRARPELPILLDVSFVSPVVGTRVAFSLNGHFEPLVQAEPQIITALLDPDRLRRISIRGNEWNVAGLLGDLESNPQNAILSVDQLGNNIPPGLIIEVNQFWVTSLGDVDGEPANPTELLIYTLDDDDDVRLFEGAPGVLPVYHRFDKPLRSYPDRNEAEEIALQITAQARLDPPIETLTGVTLFYGGTGRFRRQGQGENLQLIQNINDIP